MSSIYSFKGWEAKTIFLIIEPPPHIYDEGERVFDTPELIYTAITRAKNNLFILNMRHQKYDDFFEKMKMNNIIS